MEITACPNCGSKNIGIGTLGDGIIFGLSSWKEVCRDCGYQGASLVFESEDAYQRFLDALCNKKKPQQLKETDEIKDNKSFDVEKQTKEQEEIAEMGNQEDTILTSPAKKRYLLEIIVAIVLSIVFFFLISTGSFFPSLLEYLLGGFVGLVIFFFLLIVLLETLYKTLRPKKK
ncbi:MAG: hypothetical protein BV459_00735 [Thermoplasmata archaeon M11B2D]|nr:MAG: hypothetical protein BV459_00735 [Thermoplasmata archaeon M11B2D]PNX53292.1 MAG: hypothetical protein BV458_05255 [Thermoplasmata archaeon M9B2D]